MMKKMIAVLFILLTLCIVFPAAAVEISELDFEAEVVVTHTTNVNIRKRADPKSDRLAWAKPYDSFVYQGEKNGWYRITYEGRTGFISNGLAKAYVTENNNTQFVLVTHWSNPYVRSWKSKSADKIGLAASGSVLPYLGESDGYYCVYYNGRKAYISSSLGELIDDAVGMPLAAHSSSASD